jgi:hypothetical protein
MSGLPEVRLPHASAISGETGEPGGATIARGSSDDTPSSHPHPDKTRTGGDTALGFSERHPSDDPAALREQNRNLADLLVQEADALHAVREYAMELSERTGAAIDPATVAARLWQIVAGLPIPVRPCQRCVERAVALRREADLILGLAGMQKVNR